MQEKYKCPWCGSDERKTCLKDDFKFVRKIGIYNGGDQMKCPCCGNEMISGVVQSARQVQESGY